MSGACPMHERVRFDAEERSLLRHVFGIYRDVLGRDPDLGGLLYHLGRLHEACTVEDVRNEILASPEASARLASLSDSASPAGPETGNFDIGPSGAPDRPGAGLDILAILYPGGIPADDPHAYAWWLDEIAQQRSRRRSGTQEGSPAARVHFLLALGEAPGTEEVDETIRSFAKQTDARWSVILAYGIAPGFRRRSFLLQLLRDRRIRHLVGLSNGRIGPMSRRMAGDEHLVCAVRPGETVASSAVAELLAARSDADVVFSDGDATDRDGEGCRPAFGSAWDPDSHLTTPPPGLVAIRGRIFRALGGLRFPDADPGWELLARAGSITAPDRILHLPFVLRHRGPTSPPVLADEGSAAGLVRECLARTGRSGTVVVAGASAGTLRVLHPVPAPAPLVSIIVPTRDRADLLRACLEGVLARTAYPAIEVVIVDNGSSEAETRDLFSRLAEDGRVRIVRDDRPFNWSALTDAGIRASAGRVLVLLNNDIDVIDPDWLREMVSQSLRSDVGMVGAKLLYPSGTVQHAGIVLDDVSAPHVWRHAAGDSPGYRAQLATTRTVGAVTGACVAMRREVYDEVGGLDLERLPVTWGDIDLCLRVRRAGYRIVWTPYAVLHHLEQATRGPDERSEHHGRFAQEQAFFRERWGRAAVRDPYFSPNLVPQESEPRLRIWPPYLEDEVDG